MSNSKNKGTLFVVTAPSGGGKTTLCRKVIERLGATIRYSVSHTTRPPRGREQDGVDYHFVEDARFDEMIAQGELAEWAVIHRHRYGTSHKEINEALGAGVDLFLDIEGQGAMQIKQQFPQAVMIFVVPPDRETLQRRLQKRSTDDPAEVQRRLNNATQELTYSQHFDYVIVNDDLQQAIGDLESIVRAQRCRRENQIDAIRRLDTT